MKKLNKKEIDKYLDAVRKMDEYKNKAFDTWADYVRKKALFIIRAEVVAMARLCEEAGLESKFDSMPVLGELEDDLMYEELEDIEREIVKFVFPSEAYMNKMGWEEIDAYVDSELFEIDDSDEAYAEMTEEQITQELLEKCYGEYAKALPTLKDFATNVLSDNYCYSTATLMKSERAGKYLDYAEKNSRIKKTKLHKQVIECVDAITEPFHCRYLDFDDYKLVNGCVYAFATSGYFQYGDGEFVSFIHCKLSRYLCVGILDQLLSQAEKRYGYNK